MCIGLLFKSLCSSFFIFFKTKKKMKDDTSIFLGLHDTKKLTILECETGLIILKQIKKLLMDAESKYYTGVGLKYSKDFISRIVLNMIPMAGHNWNLRGYALILNMKREESIVCIGNVTFDFWKETTHELIITVSERPTPRWHNYVPGFLKFMLKGPVVLSRDYGIKKRAATQF